jgi:hypothetical protein
MYTHVSKCEDDKIKKKEGRNKGKRKNKEGN